MSRWIIFKFLLSYGFYQSVYLAERVPTNVLAFTWHVGCKAGQRSRAPRTRLLMSNSDGVTNNVKNKPTWILVAGEEESMRNKIGEYIANEGGFLVSGVADAKSTLLVCRGLVRPKNLLSSLSGSKNATTDFQYPDCLVLDVQLYGSMNGKELLNVLRSDPQLKFLPIVLLVERGRTEGYDAGADVYLSKPFDLEELLSIIEGLLKRSVSSKHFERNDNLAVMKSVELRRELSEIKELLRQFGFNSKTSTEDASIKEDLLEIKNALLNSSSCAETRDEQSENVTMEGESIKEYHSYLNLMTLHNNQPNYHN